MGDEIRCQSLSPRGCASQGQPINDPEIALCDTGNVHVHFLAQSFRAYWFYHARETLSVTTPPSKVVPGKLKVACWPLLAFSMKLRPCFWKIKGIGYKRCVSFRRRKLSPGLWLLCWCGPSHHTTASQLPKQKRSS